MSDQVVIEAPEWCRLHAWERAEDRTDDDAVRYVCRRCQGTMTVRP